MKRLPYLLPVLLAGAAFADGGGPTVTVPVDVAALVQSLGTQLGGIVAVIAGVALGFLAVRKALRWVSSLIR